MQSQKNRTPEQIAAEQAAAAHWSWNSHFGPEDGPAMGMSTLQCAFVWGPRGAEKLVVCDVEGLSDWRGQLGTDQQQLELQLRAVQGVCPICAEGFRIDPSRPPCSVETRPVPFAQPGGGMVKYLPLTVYIPVVCGAPVAYLDDAGHVQGTGTCEWKAIIRGGRAYPMDQVQSYLGQALDAAKREWQEVMRAIQVKQVKAGADMKSWSEAVNTLWQQTIPSMQRIQSGQYERGGDLSLVGAW